jgi:hypothetical protein
MAFTPASPADTTLLTHALDDARYLLMQESKIPIAVIPDPLRSKILSEVTPLLERLKEVPGVNQRQSILSKAIMPILERSMPLSPEKKA